jgi:hypothetical protein
MDLISDQAEWSQKTFSPDNIRGPVGALRHLAKETKEAEEKPKDVVEFADMLLLLLDAMRRAGHSWPDVLAAAKAKAKF